MRLKNDNNMNCRIPKLYNPGTIRLGAVNWYLGTHDLVKGRSLPPLLTPYNIP